MWTGRHPYEHKRAYTLCRAVDIRIHTLAFNTRTHFFTASLFTWRRTQQYNNTAKMSLTLTTTTATKSNMNDTRNEYFLIIIFTLYSFFWCILIGCVRRVRHFYFRAYCRIHHRSNLHFNTRIFVSRELFSFVSIRTITNTMKESPNSRSVNQWANVDGSLFFFGADTTHITRPLQRFIFRETLEENGSAN